MFSCFAPVFATIAQQRIESKLCASAHIILSTDYIIRRGGQSTSCYFVINRGKIARLFTVAKYNRFFTIHNGCYKFRDDSSVLAVRALIGTEYIKISERDSREFVQFPVDPKIVLAGQFGDRIRRKGIRH